MFRTDKPVAQHAHTVSSERLTPVGRNLQDVKASYYDAKSDLAEAKGDEVGSCRYFEKMDETMGLVIDLQRRLKERGVNVDEA